MQSTLLGIALGIIAAILAAFAAPYFVDWNAWRPQFETQASALAGTRVTIAGNIEAALLPTPKFVLRDVSFGDPEAGTGVRANEVHGALSLSALLTGRFEASEFIVSRPAIRLAIDKDGKLVLPAGASAGQEVSVGGFVFEAGSLIVEDRRSNALLIADDFSARGEFISRDGPFRIDAGFRLNGARWILRASTARFNAEHAARIRLSLERPADGLSFEVEGLLGLADAAPRFDGKITALHRTGTLPWRMVSDAAGDASEIRFGNLELALGEGDQAFSFSGSGRLVPRVGGAIDFSLVTRRLDFDRGDPQAASKGVVQALPLVAEARQLLSALPFDGRIALAADGMTAGGQLTRDLRANIVLRAGSVALDRFEARLPGRTSVSLAGTTKGDTFAGSLSLDSEDPQMLLRWLVGQEQAAKFTELDSLRLKANVAFSPKELSFRGVDAAFGAVKISGVVALLQAESKTRPVLEFRISATNADLDPLLPFLKSALDGATGTDVVGEVSAADLRVLGKTAKLAALSFSIASGEVGIDRLMIDEFDGFSLAAKRAAGKQIDFTANIGRTGGLSAVIEYLSGSSEFASLAAKYASPNLPLKLSGYLEPRKDDWRGLIKSNHAQFEGTIGALRENRRVVDIILQLPDTQVAAKGDLRLSKDGRVEPALALDFKSSDLRNAFAVAARAAAHPVTSAGKAKFVRDGNDFVFDALSFDLMGARGTGRIAIPVGETGPFAGQLNFDRANAKAIAALGLGVPNPASGEIGIPALANLPGALRIEIASLGLTERLAIGKARFNLRAGRTEMVIDEFSGDIAGGRISGTIRFADTSPRAAEGKLEIADAKLQELLGIGSVRGTVRGVLTLGAGGANEEALLSSIAGQGTISISGLEIDRADPSAVAVVFKASADSAPDDAAIERALATMLARGPLKATKFESQVVAANGVFRADQFRAKAGNAELAANVLVNLPKQSLDGALAIETPGEFAVRPGAAIRWQGPLTAPERKTDARALITAITLRAIERGVRSPTTQIVLPLPEQELVLPSSAPSPKRRPVKVERPARAPTLPPPVNILPVPPPRQQQLHREMQN